jgi:hypothetical protein
MAAAQSDIFDLTQSGWSSAKPIKSLPGRSPRDNSEAKIFEGSLGCNLVVLLHSKDNFDGSGK